MEQPTNDEVRKSAGGAGGLEQGKQPQITVAQLGARMHYAIPRILEEAGMLHRFCTDISAANGVLGLLRQVLPDSGVPSVVQRFLERVPEGVPPRKISSFPVFGLRYKVNRLRAASKEEMREAHLWAGQSFGNLVGRAGLEGADAVYAFRTAALEIFQEADRLGIVKIFEQPCAHTGVAHDLLAREYDSFPKWAGDLPPRKKLSVEIARAERERSLADVVLCGTDFVRESLGKAGESTENCKVVPFGVDNVDYKGMSEPRRPTASSPLRVLMVGKIGLWKGAQYLAEVARASRSFTDVRAVGPIRLTEHGRKLLAEDCTLTGQVPRSEVHEHYRWADVLVHPSISEGSATVTYEALAHGLPVVCTFNTGSIVRDGSEGFLVPIRNSEAIVERLNQLATDSDLYESMSAAALRRYQEMGSLKAYASRLTTVLREVL